VIRYVRRIERTDAGPLSWTWRGLAQMIQVDLRENVPVARRTPRTLRT